MHGSLTREKSFTILALAMLGLDIGAIATVFSVVDSVLLKPIPYQDPDRLYSVSVSFSEIYEHGLLGGSGWRPLDVSAGRQI